MIAGWRKGIQRIAARICKSATSNLSSLPSGCLYRKLDSRCWKIAAQITEVFRNPYVSKNAGRLDTQALQARLQHSLGSHNRNLELVIAWGQPKRDAGGLKTLGPMADLAEFYAIARLGVIVASVRAISRRPVRLTVLTGASRFFPALFTRPSLAADYDHQRQRMADHLCGAGSIDFQPFLECSDGYGRPEATEGRIESLNLAASSIDDTVVASKFPTILLNIDWENLFASKPEGMGSAPHGIDAPLALKAWLRTADTPSRDRLIRTGIMCLIDPKALSRCLAAFPGSEEAVEEAVSYMQQVAWESTRKYLALHAIDASSIELGSKETDAASPIRLSVHEKRDRRDIPAILTLGPQGGNLLSQHVLAEVGCNGQIAFKTWTELQREQPAPVRLQVHEEDEQRFLFDWLNRRKQPLGFVRASTQEPFHELSSVMTE